MRKVPWWAFGWEGHWTWWRATCPHCTFCWAPAYFSIDFNENRVAASRKSALTSVFSICAAAPRSKSEKCWWRHFRNSMKSLCLAVSVWQTLSYQRPKASLAGWTPDVAASECVTLSSSFLAIWLSDWAETSSFIQSVRARIFQLMLIVKKTISLHKQMIKSMLVSQRTDSTFLPEKALCGHGPFNDEKHTNEDNATDRRTDWFSDFSRPVLTLHLSNWF